MSDPPKRFESELTVVIDRDKLPPTAPALSDADDITVLEMLAEAERVRRDAEQDTDTLVPCAACEKCRTCGGSHMTSWERRKQWLAEHPTPPPDEVA